MSNRRTLKMDNLTSYNAIHTFPGVSPTKLSGTYFFVDMLGTAL